MTAALLWIIRFFVLYCIIKIVLSVIRSRPPGPAGPRPAKRKKEGRFDAKGKNVSEADFKEL